MATLDLKPLTKETIDKMGFNNHDLWMVKIGEEVYGPFEVQSLKHYASENESQFDGAEATRVENNDFRPFWTHALFQRRSPEVVHKQIHSDQFWLFDLGQKRGPFSFRDIDKKLEMGLLSVTDQISVDDGHSWKKIFEIEGLDRRSHSAQELPEAPLESAFQRARLSLIEKVERPHTTTQNELAGLVHEGKVLTLKLDELTLNNLQKTEVSSSLKWAVPGAAAILITLVSLGHYALTPGAPEEIVTASASSPSQKISRTRAPNPSQNLPRSEMPAARRPASVGHAYPPSSFNDNPRFPTHIETHEEARFDAPPEQEPQDHMNTDMEAPPVQEHSLVNNNTQVIEEGSLDAAMSGGEQPEQPVVEEASDF